MSKPSQFDFGSESRTTDFKNARVVLMFASSGAEADFGTAPGPLAVADAGRYAEFYEMEGAFSPFEIGVCSEIISKEEVQTRILEATQIEKIPIVVAESRSKVQFSVDAQAIKGGRRWYEFLDGLESDFLSGVGSAEIIGVSDVAPRSYEALVVAQILIKMVGFVWKASR